MIPLTFFVVVFFFDQVVALIEYYFAQGMERLAENQQQVNNLIELLDGYVQKGGHHLNVNVFSKETLLDAQAHPENYPDLIVRVTGFSAKFTSLSRAWQDEVISRNFYE